MPAPTKNQQKVDSQAVPDQQNASQSLVKERRQVQRPLPQPEVVEDADLGWDLWEEPTVPAPLN